MTNREDNLKKINVELENVSGGTCAELADDSRFLNVLLQGTQHHHCDRYGAFKLFFSKSSRYDVYKSLNSVGVSIVFSDLYKNEYFIGKKQVSQAEAWAHAEKQVGKHLERKDWDW